VSDTPSLPPGPSVERLQALAPELFQALAAVLADVQLAQTMGWRPMLLPGTLELVRRVHGCCLRESSL
jgi:hypothetical protein